MKKVFWDNPYLDKIKTIVETVNGNQVLFEETIAYSFFCPPSNLVPS